MCTFQPGNCIGCGSEGVNPWRDVPMVDFMYLVFTRMPGESYLRRLRSLLFCACVTYLES